MTEQFVREIDIRGQRIRVYIDKEGRFFTAEPELRSDSWESLRKGLMDLTKKATTTLSIAITAVQTRSLVDGTLRGRHAGNGNLLVLWAGKRTAEQVTHYTYNKCFRRLTEAEKTEWRRLSDANRLAHDALETWQEEREVDPRKLVDEALNKAVQDG